MSHDYPVLSFPVSLAAVGWIVRWRGFEAGVCLGTGGAFLAAQCHPGNLRIRRAYFATSCLCGYSRGLTATGKDGGLGTVTAAELGQDVTHMGVDGPLGDKEPLGDLLIRQAPGDQLSDLAFALSEREFLLLRT